MSMDQAISAAIRQSGIGSGDIYLLDCTEDNNYYYIEMKSEWLFYECYIDRKTAELTCINTIPVQQFETDQYTDHIYQNSHIGNNPYTAYFVRIKESASYLQKLLAKLGRVIYK